MTAKAITLFIFVVGGCASYIEECNLCIARGGTYTTMWDGESQCIIPGKRLQKEGKVLRFVDGQDDCFMKPKEKQKTSIESGSETVTKTVFACIGVGILISSCFLTIFGFLLKKWIKKWFSRLPARSGPAEQKPEEIPFDL